MITKYTDAGFNTFYIDEEKVDKDGNVTDLEYLIGALEEKYFKLVWAARKPHPNDLEGQQEYFDDDDPESIVLGCRMGVMKVHQNYPAEMERLSSEFGEWEHGFNSGILAAMRFLGTAIYSEYCESEECRFGGLQDAINEFPFLDT